MEQSDQGGMIHTVVLCGSSWFWIYNNEAEQKKIVTDGLRFVAISDMMR